MEQKMFFANSKGDKLCGILTNPTGDVTQPLIILTHGFHSTKNTKNFLLLRELLAQHNFSVFRFDTYGQGESEGKFEQLTVSEGVDDILQAIAYLKRQHFTRMGLIGSSFGGNASIMAAVRTHDLSVLALKSPVSNYEEKTRAQLTQQQIQEWKDKGYRDMYDGSKEGKPLRLNYSYFEDFKYNDGYSVAPQITIPTIIVHGDKDESVPVEQSIKLSKLIPQSTLVLIKGADHTYSYPDHTKQMAHAITDFIVEHV